MMQDKQTTCMMCNHEHKNEDGSCECGCTGMAGAKVCTMCNHVHTKADGACDCGCAG